MKKIKVVLFTLLLVSLLSGCNKSLFEGMDSYSDSDSDVFYAKAEQIINSGDKTAIADLEVKVEDRIVSNPAEKEQLTLMLSEIKMALAGVDIFGTAIKLYDLINSNNVDVNITSIFELSPNDIDNLKVAVYNYNATLSLTPENVTSEMKKTYLSAGMANTIYAASLLIDVFDTNGDGKVTEADANVSDAAITGTTDSVITRWASSKEKVINSIEKSVIYLNTAFGLTGDTITGSADNKEMVTKVEEIKDELSLYALSQAEIDNETDPVKKAKMKLINVNEFQNIISDVLKGNF